MSNSGDVLSKPASVLKRITYGGLEAEPPVAGGCGGSGGGAPSRGAIFLRFLEKKLF